MILFQTARRLVPPNIPRPDYADDPKGRSKSEEEEREKGEGADLAQETLGAGSYTSASS